MAEFVFTFPDAVVCKTRTLAELRTEVYQQADIEGATNAFPTSEIDRYINEAYSELWDLIIQSRGQEYFLKAVDIVASASGGNGAGRYDLPCDVYSALRVEKIDNNINYPLRPMSMHTWQRASSAFPVIHRGQTLDGQYRFAGAVNSITGEWTQHIYLSPQNFSGTIRIWYIPHCPTLDADGDVVNGVNGWEEYIVLAAVIRVLNKEQTDARDFEYRRQRMETRIRTMADIRDGSFTETIQDTEEFDDPFGGRRG